MRTSLAATVALGALALGACTPEEEPTPDPAPDSTTAAVTAPASGAPEVDLADPRLDDALSDPVADRVYPRVGDPGVDALHYQLDLAWTPDTSTLDAVEILTFRATADADRFRLDFSPALEATAVTVDGEDADFAQRGKDLVVQVPVRADDRHQVEIRYHGTPKPVAAPTTRSDFSTLGWTITDERETWTMQEPFGAYSWYAVNDHPSDKALYDFTISVPAPWVGVANGALESRTESDGNTITEWHLDQPAASYLVTVAIGDFKRTDDESESGIPITYWTPRDRPIFVRRLRATAPALDWAEEKLGPYPFSTLGVVLVDSMSGMETQTMITLGTNDYATSPEVLLHEIVHQWYGNQITPTDWRDVWMNEGMTMYFQGMWEAERQRIPLDELMQEWADQEPQWRREAGPPANYDPATFGESNIYYLPALMWHELRQRIGAKRFFAMARAWPSVDEDGNAGRVQYLAWVEEQTGEELSAFFREWLLAKHSPLR